MRATLSRYAGEGYEKVSSEPSPSKRERVARIVRRVRALLAATLTMSCALLANERSWPRQDPVIKDNARFVVQFEDADEASAREVESVLPGAADRLREWGGLPNAVFIRIQPSHSALEQAAQRYGYPWLRAWARFDTIDLQSPRSWPDAANGRQLAELLTHELTHCLTYQHTGTASDWADKNLPLWFREGMASVVAEQDYRRATIPQLAGYLRDHPKTNLLADADGLYKTDPDLVYGAAHQAFALLLRKHGRESILAMFDAIRNGAAFSDAMKRSTGIGEAEFAVEFDRFVRSTPER